MKKALKSPAGFTLVELVVVMAILGILAGAAVPAYNGYVTKARDAAVIVRLSAVSAAIRAADAQNEAIGSASIDGNSTITFLPAAGGKMFAPRDFYAEFSRFYGTGAETEGDSFILRDLTLAGTSYENGAVWDGTAWTAQ